MLQAQSMAAASLRAASIHAETHRSADTLRAIPWRFPSTGRVTLSARRDANIDS
jgi:hypothetical protein